MPQATLYMGPHICDEVSCQGSPGLDGPCPSLFGFALAPQAPLLASLAQVAPPVLGMRSLLGGGLPSLRVAWDSLVKQRVGLSRLMSSISLGTETAAALGDSQGPCEGSYSPQEALELALLDWVAEINQQALETGR